MESGRFADEKARALSQVDLSRKGSVDEPIAALVRYINALPAYYTTSSCSGRITAFCLGEVSRKQGCVWLLTSHDEINISQLESSLVDLPEGYTYFKFEPFVLHCMCLTLEDAQRMLQVAIGAGFRNSGFTCGRKKRIMLAVRSSHSLELPLAFEGRLIVSNEYLQHLVAIANGKLQENLTRVNKFSQELQRCLSCSAECVSSKHRTPSRSEAARKITAKQKPLSSSGHDVIEQDYDVTDGPIEELTNLFASEM